MSACKCGATGLLLEHDDGRRECPRCIDAERELLRAKVAELEADAGFFGKELRKPAVREAFMEELASDEALSRIDALAAQLERMQANAREARSHLGAALTQTIDSDDQIIVGHIRDALAFLNKDKPAPPKEEDDGK